MIEYSDVLNAFEETSKKNNSIRNNGIHMSEIAICGFKYRYRRDNNLFLPFNINFHIGNAYEYLIVNQMKKLGNISSQYVVKYVYGNTIIEGHTDAFDIDNKVIYELKTSFSDNNFEDIYLRQLKAYMHTYNIANVGSVKGRLWIFKPAKKVFKDVIVDYITKEDVINFNSNIKAYFENRYIEGIENSLCSFCENVNCKMRGVKIK